MTGVLVMAYGTARDRHDVERYYTHIRHGRPPSPEQLDDLVARYEAIGGSSPLSQITEQEARGLQDVLDRRNPGRYRVYLGMKHAPPFIEEGISAMRRDGIQRAVGLVLAPHYSAMSVGAYMDDARGALVKDSAPFEWLPVRSWGTEPGLIDLLASRIEATRLSFSAVEQDDLPIIFSAHSLPARILLSQDPYPHELRQTGDMVASKLLTSRYTFSWQSAGRTSEPWMGPDILEKLTMMAHEGFKSALICPAGFISDHLEVLYDLDIQAQEHAAALGMHVERTPSLNADPAFMEVLADVVERRDRGSR